MSLDKKQSPAILSLPHAHQTEDWEWRVKWKWRVKLRVKQGERFLRGRPLAQ